MTVICPECGEKLVIVDASRPFVFCQCCGTKIKVNVNVNLNYSKSEHTERIVDEAKIKAAENVDRVIGIFASPFEEYRKAKEEKRRKEEELERKLEEQQRKAQEQARIRNAKIAAFCKTHPKELLITVVTCCALLVGGGLVWKITADHNEKVAAHQAELARLKEIEITNSHLAMGEAKIPELSTHGDYRDAVKSLKDAGFTNISAKGKGDMIFGLLETENAIEEITVDGAPTFDTNIWYPLDVPIVISYHSFYQSVASSASANTAASSSTNTAAETETKSHIPTIDEYMAAQSAASSVSKESPSILTDDDHESSVAHEFAYILDQGSYYTCYYIDFSNDTVYYFAYGNGDETAMVAHITSGTYQKGITVHYNYAPGWDETMSFSSDGMTLTDAYGNRYTYAKTDTSDIARILAEREIIGEY